MDPKPAPVFASRGARLSLYFLAPVLLAVVLTEIAAFVAFLFQRRMTWPEYMGAALGGILVTAIGVVPLVKSVIDGWTKQDEARINASAPPKPPQVQQIAVASTDGHATPAETPSAKQRDSAT